MTLEITCACGKAMKVPDSVAGRKGKCPQCGAVVSIPPLVAPPAPPKKKDDLVLELEEAPKVERPVEALVPPKQDLDGPKSGSAKRPSVKGKTLPPPGPVPPDKIACPKCGALYEKHMPFCSTCSIDLNTGKPISGVMPGGARRSGGTRTEEFDENMPFWKLTLRMLYQPWKMLEVLPLLLTRKDIQVQMGVFYALSFVAIVVGAKAMGRTMEQGKVTGPTEAEQLAEIEKETGFLHAPTEWKSVSEGGVGGVPGTGPDFVVKVTEPLEAIAAGERFTLKISFCEPGPGKGIDGEVWAIKTEHWGGDAAADDWEQARPGGQPGDYVLLLRSDIAAGTSYTVRLYPKKGDGPDVEGAPWRGGINLSWPSAPGWAKKVLEGRKNPDFDPSGETESEKLARMERKRQKLTAYPEWTLAHDERSGKQVGEKFLYKFAGPTELDVDQVFSAIVYFAEVAEGDKPGEPIVGDVWVTWDKETVNEGELPYGEIQAAQGPEPGSYTFELKAVAQPVTQCGVSLYRPGQKDPGGLRGQLNPRWPMKPGWAKIQLDREKAAKAAADGSAAEAAAPIATKTKKALIGGAAVVGSILMNILGLVISAAVFTAAARLLGGGGSFLLMLITLAYLTGFSNLAQVILAFAPTKHLLWLQFASAAYFFVLGILALMKVYDLDLMGALLTNVVAGFIQMFVVAWLVLAMMGTAVVVAG